MSRNLFGVSRKSKNFNSLSRDRVRRIFRKVAAVAAGVGLVLSPLVGVVGAANAAGGNSNYLDLTKTVTGASGVDVNNLKPGDTFTYEIDFGCSEVANGCANAQLTDAIPAALKGYTLTNVTAPAIANTLTWSENDASISQPTTIGSDTNLTINFTAPLGGGLGNGIQTGKSDSVTFTLQVPNDFSPSDPRNDVLVTNKAEITASNSDSASDSANVTPNVAESIAASIKKTWWPSSATYNPGAASTITLTGKNTSNVAVDKLVIQDPQASDAPADASALDDDNPFTITDFDGFGTTTLPSGATAVQVDAYVEGSDGKWNWVTGTSDNTYTLPSGVTNAEVGGLRFTYTGDIAVNASAAPELNLVQRSTNRNDGSDLSKAEHSVKNVASAQTSKDDKDSDLATDNATYKVTPAVVKAGVTKSITPSRLPQGSSADAELTPTNTGSAVQTMTVSDYNETAPFFTDKVTFGGFSAGINYPDNATSGKVVYYLLDGGKETASFADGATPADPTSDIAGFDVVFSASGNDIVNNAQTSIKYTIDTADDAPADVTRTNTVTNTVEAANGQTADVTDSKTLTPVKPSINVTLEKHIKPDSPITPGSPSVVSLPANTSSDSDYVKPKTMVVEDSWGANGSDKATDYWNAFNVTSVLPTQIPADAAFTLEVQKADGTWITIDSQDAKDEAWLYSLSTSDFTSKLPSGVTADELTGIRFTFTKQDGTFPASTTVSPNIGFVARATLRDGSAATDTTHNASAGTTYTNNANVVGTGKTPAGTTLTGDDTATDVGKVWIPTAVCDSTCVNIDKTWDADNSDTSNGDQGGAGASVDAQSQETRITHLNWATTTGFDKVEITDPNDVTDVSDTVFDAFNLVSITKIAASDTPYSNGWYLKYDTISKIELYIDGDWTTVTEPSDGWQSTDGSFVGYTLSSAEQGDLTGTIGATGVRITLTPNDAARAAALADGSDIYAPEPGSGVAAASDGNRTFDLQWQLRNKTRSTGAWVTPDAALNNGDGDVQNVVGVTGTRADGSKATDTASADISILNKPAGVQVDKSVTPNDGTTTNNSTPLLVPASGSGADLPTATYTITANNKSTTSAQYVKVVDPSPCTDTAISSCQTENSEAGSQINPFLNVTGSDIDTPAVPNPFNRLDIKDITIAATITDQVDLSKSTAWLLKYDRDAAGTNKYSVVTTTAAAVNDMTATQFADVVGIAVSFQGSDPENGGTITQKNDLTIKLDTQVRATFRDTGETQNITEATQVKNRTFAQSYDTVTGLSDALTGDTSDATVNLTNGTLDVVPGKTISGDPITELNRDTPQTVTLTANQGSSTALTNKVVLSDVSTHDTDTAAFWDAFEFTGLGTIIFPSGADQVQIDAYGDFGSGTAGWTDGTASATPTVPVAEADYSKITGLRFTFTRADGKEFSTKSPNWSTSVPFKVVLRDSVPASEGDTVFGGTATNTMTAQSFGVGTQSAVEEADDDVSWSAGTHELEINKLANTGTRSVAIGNLYPWDLTIKNSGTAAVDLSTVVDEFPSTLKFLGTDDAGTKPGWTFTPDTTSGSTLTEEPTLTVDSGKLTLTWADGKAEMQPGETVKIRIWFELEPGDGDTSYCVGSDNPGGTCNKLTVNTVQTLDNQGEDADAGGSDGSAGVVWNGDNSLSTSDYVTPLPSKSLLVNKGVLGSLPGATDSNCTPTLSVDGTDYFRPPCVANSTVNGTDKWALSVVNSSTQSVQSAVLFDQLPIVGDSLVVSGNDRGTQYRPQMLDDFKVVGAPAGTVQSLEVTYASDAEIASGNAGDDGVCVNTWGTLLSTPLQDPCVSNGESWQAVPDAGLTSAQWAKVTGLRIKLNFVPAGGLKPGQSLGVTYSTKNVAATSDTAGASTDIPVTDTQAWNQFGLQYVNDDGIPKRLAPSQVGVHLRTGSIAVVKNVEGAAAGKYAPDSFTASVICKVGDTALTFDGGHETKTVTLKKQDDGSYKPVVISGIPLGTSAEPTHCDVAEDGDQGQFGESTRSVVNGSISVTTPDEVGADVTANDVPTTQVATLTNTYDFSGLSVTKKVDTQATVGTFGPFTFNVKCTVANGTDTPTPVTFDGKNSTSFSISNGQTWKAPADTIPAGATCVLTETDTSAADGTAFAPIDSEGNVITGDNVVDNGTNSDGNPQATITVGDSASDVVSTLVTNHYDAGTFKVTKKVDGDGSEQYGTGPFTFTSVCTYKDTQTLLDETYSLNAGDSKTFGVFPAGTECVTKEIKSGGANASTITPADPEDDAQSKIVIQRQSPVEDPSASASPSATDSASPSASLANDEDSELPPLSNVDVTATNTFNVGSLKIDKVRTGAGAELYGNGPFEATVKCTWQKDGETTPITLANGGKVELNAANNYAATIDNLPVGASCNVAETKTGGATSSATDPSGGNVTITDSETSPASVTITNTFDVGSIKIVKKRVGPGANTLGADTFGAQVKCTNDIDGVTTAVNLADNGNVTLSKANGYTATVNDVPIGSNCTVAETVRGSADEVTIDHPTVELSTTYPHAYVTITNHFPALPSNGNGANGNGNGLATTGLGLGALFAALGAIVAGGVLLATKYRRRRNNE